MEGRGTPHTRTETLTLERMVSLEQRMSDAENLTARNIGVPQLKVLVEQGHDRAKKEDDGTYSVLRGTNTILRLDLDAAHQKIEALEKSLAENQKLWEVASSLIQNYEKTLNRVDRELDSLREGKAGEDSDLSGMAQTMAQALEGMSSRLDQVLEAVEASGSGGRQK